MNLKRKGVRRTLGVACSTAVVAAGASFAAAAPAFAATGKVHAKSTLSLTGGSSVTDLDLAGGGGFSSTPGSSITVGTTLNSTTISGTTLSSADVGDLVTGTGVPSGTYITTVASATSATISQAATATNATASAYRNDRKSTTSANLLNASYGVRVTSAVTSPVWFKLLTAPSASAKLYVQETSSSTGVPSTSSSMVGLSVGGSDGSQHLMNAGSSSPGNDRLYLAPDTPGSYTFEFFEDIDNNGVVNTTDDNVSQVVTLNALHVGTSNSTWTPTVSAPYSVNSGQSVPVATDLSGLTLSDARGSSAIGTALSNLIQVAYTGTTTATPSTQSGGFSGTSATDSSTVTNTTSAAQTLTSTALFDLAGNSWGSGAVTLGAPTTTVAAAPISANPVSTLTAANVTGSVKQSTPATTSTGQTAYIKAGTSSVTYDAVTTSATSGTTVRFTLTPILGTSSSTVTCSTTATNLTGNGTLLSSTGTGGVKVYSAQTDSTGTAALTVTSSDTTGNCPSYTVAADTNGTTATTTAKYVVSTPSSIAVTNASSDLLPAVGTATVTLKASLEDQFGQVVAPLSADSQQATLTVGATTASVPVSGSTFSYTYTPSTTPASATSQSFSWSYTGGSVVTSTLSTTGKIVWVTSTSAGSVVLSTPVNGASNVNLSSSKTIAPLQNTSGDTFGENNSQVTGTVMDSSGNALPYKSVTLSGTAGVYFSDKSDGSDPLTKTMSVVTNGSGQFSGAYAYFTQAGSPTITATSDSKTATATVTTVSSTDPYIVSLNDALGTPSSAISITGKVVDIFGNPVPNEAVALSVSPSTSGSFGSSWSGYTTTASDGSFSAAYTPNAGVDSKFTVTATLYSSGSTSNELSSNPVANAGWASNAGLTSLPTGQYEDTGTLIVGPVLLSGPSSRVGQGFVNLEGVADPNSTVKIYGRTVNSTAGQVLLDTVMANSKGDFSAVEWLTDTTTFVADEYSSSTDHYSTSVTVVMTSGGSGGGSAVIKQVVVRTLGSGWVSVTVVGDGNGGSTVTVFKANGKSWIKLAAVKARSTGVQVIKLWVGKGSKTIRVAYASSGKSTAYKNTNCTVK